jgi:hypothetical protein
MNIEDNLGEYMKDLSQNVTNDIVDELTKVPQQYLDDRKKTYNFWKTLRTANKDYLALDLCGDGTFGEFILHNYGIQLYFDDGGAIKAHFDIVDEQKHLLFVLKYS